MLRWDTDLMSADGSGCMQQDSPGSSHMPMPMSPRCGRYGMEEWLGGQLGDRLAFALGPAVSGWGEGRRQTAVAVP
jgi:hypothetical protein